MRSMLLGVRRPTLALTHALDELEALNRIKPVLLAEVKNPLGESMVIGDAGQRNVVRVRRITSLMDDHAATLDPYELRKCRRIARVYAAKPQLP